MSATTCDVAEIAYVLRTFDDVYVSESDDRRVEVYWDGKAQQYKAHCTFYTFGSMDPETGVRDRWEDEVWYTSSKSLLDLAGRLEGDGWRM